ncbi:unnamed protein product, partial [Effrenium voratum]
HVAQVVEIPVAGDTVPGAQQRSAVDLPPLRQKAAPEVRSEVVQGPDLPMEVVRGLVTSHTGHAGSGTGHLSSRLGSTQLPPASSSGSCSLTAPLQRAHSHVSYGSHASHGSTIGGAPSVSYPPER